MKKYIYPLLLASALTAVACSDDENITDIFDEEVPADQKQAIAFTVSDLGAVQQGSQTRAGFTAATQIVARFESAHEDNTKGTRSTRTILTATADGTLNEASYSTVDYYKSTTEDKSYIRYWDDAFGRYASISVYAVAVPTNSSTLNNNHSLLDLIDFSGTAVSESNNPKWKTGSTNNVIEWHTTTGTSTTDADGVTTITGQTKASVDNEDLCYSNNIQATPASADKNRGKYGRYVYDFTIDNETGKETGYPAMSGIANNHTDGALRIALKTSTDKTSNGKFDKGHLIFEHALSRITVTLQSSSDYTGDFKFSNGNIKLLDMNVAGKLDIKTGLWEATKTTDAIYKMAPVAKNSSGALVADDARAVANGTYMAQMLPGYIFTKDNKEKNVMEFTIDNNTYFITQADLFKSLNDNAGTGDGKNGLATDATAYTMEMGKNYVFTITLNKTKIENITATVADWVDVVAEEIKMDNSHVEFSFLSPTGTTCDEINFYRLAEDLTKIYTDNSYINDGKGVTFSGNYGSTAATLTEMTGTNAGKYSTNWFYDNNRTAYHFRTVNNNGKATLTTPTTDPKNTYFVMNADATSKDYHWGAPMKTSANLAYSTTEGYKSSLHEGITSTKSDIKIQELHMMSNLEIVLKTEGDGKVNLEDASVTLTKLSTSANVDMGIGLITPLAPESPTTWATAKQSTTAPATYWATGQETNKLQTNAFTCAVIPQSLVRGTSTPSADDYVGITITTSDENQYYVIAKLSEIKATSVKKGDNDYADPNHPKDDDGNYQAITRWYPNHTYKYTFTITKKGIENITCTVADWVKVTGEDIKIDLES